MLLLACFPLFLEIAIADEETSETYLNYLALQKLQQEAHKLALERQQRLQPLLHEAERRACAALRKEQRKGVPPATYHQEGGDQFLAFVLQFDRYCQAAYER